MSGRRGSVEIRGMVGIVKMRESDFRSPEVGISVFWGSFGKDSKNMADRSKLETILTEKENPIASGSLEMTKFCNRED